MSKTGTRSCLYSVIDLVYCSALFSIFKSFFPGYSKSKLHPEKTFLIHRYEELFILISSCNEYCDNSKINHINVSEVLFCTVWEATFSKTQKFIFV